MLTGERVIIPIVCVVIRCSSLHHAIFKERLLQNAHLILCAACRRSGAPQVKENRSATAQVSILLSGITVSLAGKTNEDSDVDHLVEMFKNNTLSRIDMLIDE